jgi:hypothetical protein
MRRTGLLLLVGALSAAVMPLSAGAGPVPEDEAGLVLGGQECALIDVPAVTDSPASPVGVGTCPGVRPGARVITDKGMCTFNFMFTGADGERYMGTAGHCIMKSGPVGEQNSGEAVWEKGQGPVARDSEKRRIGEFAYAVLASPKDFALIRLDPGVEASPSMCHFGGPHGGMYDGTTEDAELVVLQYFGMGLGIGNVLPARSAVAAGVPDTNHVRAAGVAIPGDSGSGVISSDGRAVGVLVTVGAHVGDEGAGPHGVDAGTIGITRLVPQVTRAEEALGLDLEMVNAG